MDFARSRQPCLPVSDIAPLLPVAITLILGILAARFLGPRLPWLTAILLAATFALLLAVVVLTQRSQSLPVPSPRIHRFLPILVFLAAILVGAARYRLAAFHYPDNHVLHYCTSDDRLVTARATVVTPAHLTFASTDTPLASFREPTTIASLRCTELLTPDGWKPVTGRVRLVLAQPLPHLAIGHRLELQARLACHETPPRNPGQFDRRDLHRSRRELASFYVDRVQAVTLLDPDRSIFLRFVTFRYRCQDAAQSLLLAGASDDHTRDPAVAFVCALILGQRDDLPDPLAEDFLRTGAFHFLSVSGFHVGLLAAFAWFLGIPLHLHPTTRAWIALVIVSAYLFIVPDRPPVHRAGIAAILFCLTAIGRKPANAINTLALAAILTLLFRPFDLFNAGFQLSYLVALGIVFFAPLIRDLYFHRDDPYASLIAATVSPTRRALTAVASPLASAAGIACIAWLIGLPLVAHHFHRIALWGPLATLCLLPGIVMTLLIGFIKLLFALALPTLSAWLWAPLAIFASLTFRLADLLARLPYANLSSASPPLWLFLPFYASLLAAAHAARYRRLSAPALTGLGISLALFAWLAPFHSPPRDALRLHLLSVGHGVACIVEWPDGRTICCDAGSLSYPDVGRFTLVPFLRVHGINRLDALFLSHPNIDHYSAAPALADAIDIGAVYLPGRFEPAADSAARRTLEDLRRRNIPLRTFDRDCCLDWNSPHAPRVQALWPPPCDAPAELDENDSSLVLRLVHENTAVLLTGDAGLIPQLLLAELDPNALVADVLVLPHHGAPDPTLPDFLRCISPRLCLVSAAAPYPSRRQNLANFLADLPVLYTCDVGAVTITLAPDRLDVHPFLSTP